MRNYTTHARKVACAASERSKIEELKKIFSLGSPFEYLVIFIYFFAIYCVLSFMRKKNTVHAEEKHSICGRKTQVKRKKITVHAEALFTFSAYVVILVFTRK